MFPTPVPELGELDVEGAGTTILLNVLGEVVIVWWLWRWGCKVVLLGLGFELMVAIEVEVVKDRGKPVAEEEIRLIAAEEEDVVELVDAGAVVDEVLADTMEVLADDDEERLDDKLDEKVVLKVVGTAAAVDELCILVVK